MAKADSDNSIAIIRTDANNTIGSGHLVRCLSLARELKSRGIIILFVFQITSEHYYNILVDEGFFFKTLKPQDPPQAILKLLNNNITNKILILDTDDRAYYSLEFQKRIIKSEIKLMYITFTNQPSYMAHIVHNQNPMALNIKYNTAPYTKKLFGLKFAIIDQSFDDVLLHGSIQDSEKKNILVTFGGADMPNRTLLTLQALNKIPGLDRKVTVVTGPSYERTSELSRFLQNCRLDHEYIQTTKNMAKIMSSCGFAISSGGLTSWELALFRIPNAVISFSVREELSSNFLASKGWIYHIGNIKKIDSLSLPKKFENFFSGQNQPPKAKELYNSVNLNGKNLVADEITKILSSQ